MVTLAWTTASETNNYGFEVQRQAVGASEWRNLAFIKGAGTTNQPLAYSYQDALDQAGQYRYRLRQIDLNGAETLSHSVVAELAAPAQVVLAQNYPNPFNPLTEIQFQIPAGSNQIVTLEVYNTRGQRINTLASGTYKPGFYSVRWEGMDEAGREAASGVYFISLQTGPHRLLRKMIKLQ